jgi:two-component system LytT family response regulator
VISILLVDDEPLAHARMEALLSEFTGVEVAGRVTSLQQAKEFLATNQPDVVFLDVEMPGGSSFSLLPSIADTADVVFVTAHERHAVQAFAVGAVDYLVKPVDPIRLADTLQRLRRGRAPHPASSADASPQSHPALDGADEESPSLTVPLRLSGQKAVVRIHDICWIESLRNYTRVALHSPARLLVFRRRLGEWLPDLPDGMFARLSRSEVVQLAMIRGTEWKSRGETVVTFHDDAPPLTLGRMSAQRLNSLLDGMSASHDLPPLR